MRIDHAAFFVATLALALGCASKDVPDEPGAPPRVLEGRLQAQTTVTTTGTETATATNTSTVTATASQVVTVTQTTTNTVTATGTGTAPVTQTLTVTATATSSRTGTVTQTATKTATSTATRTGSAPGIYQQIYTFTGTVTSTGTAIVYYASWPHWKGNTATATTNQFASGTAVATVTRTVTSPFNRTETKTASCTVTGSGTRTGTATVTVTQTVTTSITNAGTGTRTLTATGTATGTVTQTWTATWTSRVTQTVTNTTTRTVTNTTTVTNGTTDTSTHTLTQTASQTTTVSTTSTATGTNTTTSTGTKATTATITTTDTVTNTVTLTLTGTDSDTSVDGGSGTGPSCSSWNFDDGTVGAWTSSNVTLAASSPGYGGTGSALSWHHAYTNSGSTGISMMVPLCEGGLDSITGITFQARFVPDPGYGDFPNTNASKAILLDAGQVEVMDSFTPFGGSAAWGVVSRTFNAVSASYLRINLQAMGDWQGTVYIDDVSLARADGGVSPSCSSWNFDDGTVGAWTSSNVTLAASSPGYGGTGSALSWHHAYTNSGSTGISMMVPLCEGGLDSITGITFQARFVPDPGYGDFPNTNASKAILLDAGQVEVMDSFTPFGGNATWGVVSRTFNAVSASYLRINLQAMGDWQGTVYIDDVSLTKVDGGVSPSCSSWNFDDGTVGAWTSSNVTLAASSPGYGGTGSALSWHHAYTNSGSTGISMMVPLCEGGLDSITGITFQARFVPDPGYGDFPNTNASKAILLDAGQVEVQDSFTPFGGNAAWGVVSRTFNAVSASYLRINLQAMGDWQGTVYIDNVSLTKADGGVSPSCSSWNFDDGTVGAWTSSNVTLAASSPGYGGTGSALSWHHAYTNSGSTGISMMVPLCEGGLDSITGITFQARFVPDPGYGDFPNTNASKAILLDAGQVEVQDSFTPFGGNAAWGVVSRTFNAVSASYLRINLQAMGDWQGTVYIDNVSLTKADGGVSPSCSSWNFDDGTVGAWTSSNVTLAASSPGYGGTGSALSWHHAYTNSGSTGISMMVPLCEGGLDSITGITFQARFVPDPGYGDFPNTNASKAILLDAGQVEVMDSFTPFGGSAAWGVVSRTFNAVSASYLRINLQAMGDWQGTVYIDDVSLARADGGVSPSCSSWNFDDGTVGAWTSSNVTLAASSPGYGGTGSALSWHHAYTNSGSTGISMMVPLCEGGLDSITGITFQARFVPDPGYGDFPNTNASKAILLDAGQVEVQDSFTPFGGNAAWGVVSRTFNAVSASYLRINLQAMGDWQGTVYIDNIVLTPQ